MDAKKKKELLDIVDAEITAAKKYFDDVRAPAILEAFQIYEADPKYYQSIFKRLGKLSDYVSKDVANAVEWALPSLMNVFGNTSSVVSIVPYDASSEKAAEVNQKLLDFQLQTLNNSTILFYRWFKDALIASLGIVKAWWYEDSRNEKRVLVLSPQEYLSLVNSNPNVTVANVEYLQENGLVRVTVLVNRSYASFPKIAPLPPWECLYNPKCLDLHESSFICHRKEVTVDFLRKQARNGIFDAMATAEAIRQIQEDEITDDVLKSEVQAKIIQYDEPDKRGTPGAKTVLYESYFDFDINGDGLLESVIVTTCNGQLLRVEENNFGGKPFFALSPMVEPYQPEGKSYANIIDDIQKAKTGIMRQVLLNLSLVNNPRMKILEGAGVNVSDIITNRQLIRVGDLRSVEPMETPPLAPWTFNVMEMLEVDKENRTGVTRYSQGLDAQALNKTATGIMKIMQASQQRLALIALLFAETGIRNLFRFMVGLNQRFIRQEQVIRVASRPLQIMPDDLQGKFHFVVEPSALLGGKEKEIAAMERAVEMAPVLIQQGYMSREGFYNLLVRYYETLGLKAVEKYIDQNPAEAQQNGNIMGSQERVSGTVGQGIEGQGFGISTQGLYQGGQGTNQAGMENIGY